MQTKLADAIAECDIAIVKCEVANMEAERVLKYALWIGISQVLAFPFMLMILILACPGSTPTTAFYIVATAWILCETVSVGTLVVLIITSLIGSAKVFHNWLSGKIKRKR